MMGEHIQGQHGLWCGPAVLRFERSERQTQTGRDFVHKWQYVKFSVGEQSEHHADSLSVSPISKCSLRDVRCKVLRVMIGDGSVGERRLWAVAACTARQ